MTKIPDIFNSRTEKVHLELPNYAYSHSSSAENKTKSFFLGRKKLKVRLKNLIISTSSKTGVYLVAGNRGVGKSSLVEEVINETSISTNKGRSYFTFLFISLFLILGMQYITNQFPNSKDHFLNSQLFAIILAIIAFFLFLMIGHFSYLKRYEKKKFLKKSIYTLCAGIREFSLLPHSSNPYLRTQNTMKLCFLLIFIHLVSTFSNFTHFHIFLSYIVLLLIINLLYLFRKKIKENKEGKLRKFVRNMYEKIFSNYVKNCNRVYLKINFGHDVLKELDILRLIARTLSTEYYNFCRSLKHTFYWRILFFSIIFSVSYMFYQYIYKKDILPMIELQHYYKNSTQFFYYTTELGDTIFINDCNDKCLKNKLVSIKKRMNSNLPEADSIKKIYTMCL